MARSSVCPRTGREICFTLLSCSFLSSAVLAEDEWLNVFVGCVYVVDVCVCVCLYMSDFVYLWWRLCDKSFWLVRLSRRTFPIVLAAGWSAVDCVSQPNWKTEYKLIELRRWFPAAEWGVRRKALKWLYSFRLSGEKTHDLVYTIIQNMCLIKHKQLHTILKYEKLYCNECADKDNNNNNNNQEVIFL